MTQDSTTFLLAFSAVFGLVAWLLLRLSRKVDMLQAEVEALQAQDATANPMSDDGDASIEG